MGVRHCATAGYITPCKASIPHEVTVWVPDIPFPIRLRAKKFGKAEDNPSYYVGDSDETLGSWLQPGLVQAIVAI